MRIKIKFFDYWHLSSGLSAGATLDSLVVKDENGLPYVPGKTIKGLVREMAEYIGKNEVKKIFGDEGSLMSESYFTNAVLKKELEEYLVQNPDLQDYLYSKITSTKLDGNGIVEDNTLREIEAVIPLEFYGEIECKDEDLIRKSIGMIKQMGLARNRGLGRCEISEV